MKNSFFSEALFSLNLRKKANANRLIADYRQAFENILLNSGFGVSLDEAAAVGFVSMKHEEKLPWVLF
jgi:hypothetical protein